MTHRPAARPRFRQHAAVVLLCTALMVVLVALAIPAGAGNDAPWRADLLVSTPGPSDDQRALRQALLASPGDVAAALAQDEESADPEAFSEARDAPRRWWPVALSVLVPGLGEAVTGHKRGYFLIAADAGAWYAVTDQNDKGNRIEDEYKAFADEHYSEDRWTDALEAGSLDPFFGGDPPIRAPEQVPLYVTKEEDEREWYENIGKWDQFAWGWREYWSEADGGNEYQPDIDNPVFVTPLRQKYVDMRGESNDAFGRRDTFLNLALLLRVFSLLQIAYLEGFVGGRYNAPEPAVDAELAPPRLSLYMAPRGLDETRIGLKVSY